MRLAAVSFKLFNDTDRMVLSSSDEPYVRTKGALPLVVFDD